MARDLLLVVQRIDAIGYGVPGEAANKGGAGFNASKKANVSLNDAVKAKGATTKRRTPSPTGTAVDGSAGGSKGWSAIGQQHGLGAQGGGKIAPMQVFTPPTASKPGVGGERVVGRY